MKVPTVLDFLRTDDPSMISESANYIFLFKLDEDRSIQIGRLGVRDLRRGTYAYCGSAKAGLWSRVRRHLSEQPRKRWHIDHVSPYSSEKVVLWKAYSPEGECFAASLLSESYDGIPGFGCSDCRCGSHLFFLG